MTITLDTPLKFTAPGGVPYAGSESFRWSLPDGDRPGEWAKQYKSAPILCKRGYHWCEAQHAIHHLNAECWLFEPAGATVRGSEKCVSQGGRLLRRVETWTERTARLFTADCAESVVHLCGDDPRPWQAIEVARRYAHGEATEEALEAANAAAVDAAWDATMDAACAAAAAAARAAAWNAAKDSAWAAAMDAARAAAWNAAMDAAGASARNAARGDARNAAGAAARAAQTARLLQYLNGEVS